MGGTAVNGLLLQGVCACVILFSTVCIDTGVYGHKPVCRCCNERVRHWI